MEFTVRIRCDNAAFDRPHHEVARMLRDLAKRVETWQDDHAPMGMADVNGNQCGRAEWSDWDEGESMPLA